MTNEELYQLELKAGAAVIKTTNPYSGQSTMLTDEEHTLYTEIKTAEMDEHYDVMQKGLDKFSRMNAKAFMVLLD